jgi:hypothetical protein
MILAEQFFTGVFRDLTKPVVDVSNSASLVGYRDNRRLVNRKFNIRKLLVKVLAILRF